MPPRANPPFGSASAAKFSISCWKSRRVTAETLDLDQLLANVGEIVHRVMPYDLFAILLYNEQAQGPAHSLCRRASRGGGAQPRRLPLGEGITGSGGRCTASRSWCAMCGRIQRYLNALRDIVRTELAVPMIGAQASWWA